MDKAQLQAIKQEKIDLITAAKADLESKSESYVDAAIKDVQPLVSKSPKGDMEKAMEAFLDELKNNPSAWVARRQEALEQEMIRLEMEVPVGD